MLTPLEPVIKLLTGLVVFFTLLLFICAKLLPMDGQTFQVVSGLLTGFAGALLMRVKPRSASDESSKILTSEESADGKKKVISSTTTEKV